MTDTYAYIDIVFDASPGHVAGRFVEVEDPTGKSIRVGTWVERDDGYWVLRLTNWSGEAEIDRLKRKRAEQAEQQRDEALALLDTFVEDLRRGAELAQSREATDTLTGWFSSMSLRLAALKGQTDD